MGEKILHDDLEDPDELVNVAEKHPEVVERLSKAIDEWIDALMQESGREVYPYAEQEAKVKASEAALKKMKGSLGT